MRANLKQATNFCTLLKLGYS